MSSSDSASMCRPLLVRIFAALIPSACLIVILATLSALLLAYNRTGGTTAGSSKSFWIMLAFVGATEMIALVVAAVATVRLSRGIAKPIGKLAEEALSATEKGGTGQLTSTGDISEIHDLTIAFNRLLAEQKRRQEELGALGSNLLHDIKTPISTMKNAAEAALSGDCASDEALATISENCDTLLLAVASNHDISALLSGIGRENLHPVDIVAESSRALQIYGFTADAKRQKLNANLPDRSILISAHRLHIQQLISNLLDNAIKYTPEGGTIDVSLSTDNHKVTLAVCDTGIGMSDEVRQKAFLRYYRADDSRHETGFGLGLPLVKAIVDFYHGEITCESAVGKGTTFTVTFSL